MVSHKIPLLPWQCVSQELFSLNKEDYLITVDHYSDFIEMDKLHDTNASLLVRSLYLVNMNNFQKRITLITPYLACIALYVMEKLNRQSKL